MKPVSRRILVAMIALLLFGTTPADAAIDFTWSFDDPLPAIGGPTTVFSMPATLVVDIESDDFVIGASGINFGSFEGEYSFTADLSALVVPGTIQAGDIIAFNFGFFTPAGPDFLAAPGEYSIGEGVNLVAGPQGGAGINFIASNLFSARVVVDGTVAEPGTLLLLGSGLAGLAAWRRRRR